MTQFDTEFLTRVESLGDNCELGFVLRNAEYEKGGLFRWTITPVDKLIQFLDNPEKELYNIDKLVPFSPGMVLDECSGFSFHSKMRSEKNEDGHLNYINNESEREKIYETEKSKIDYLKKGFLKRLQADSGSIYLIKANKGIPEQKLSKLAAQLRTFSPKHVLVHVVNGSGVKKDELIVNRGTYFSAEISRFAPYVAANDVCYSDWETLISELQNHIEINRQIGSLAKAA